MNVGVYLYSITPFSTQCYLNGMSCRPVYCGIWVYMTIMELSIVFLFTKEQAIFSYEGVDFWKLEDTFSI